MIRGLGFDVRAVDVSEFAKAEAGVTCLSILIE
jgi:N-dimethylarginine dimethylaminohydrolase